MESDLESRGSWSGSESAAGFHDPEVLSQASENDDEEVVFRADGSVGSIEDMDEVETPRRLEASPSMSIELLSPVPSYPAARPNMVKDISVLSHVDSSPFHPPRTLSTPHPIHGIPVPSFSEEEKTDEYMSEEEVDGRENGHGDRPFEIASVSSVSSSSAGRKQDDILTLDELSVEPTVQLPEVTLGPTESRLNEWMRVNQQPTMRPSPMLGSSDDDDDRGTLAGVSLDDDDVDDDMGEIDMTVPTVPLDPLPAIQEMSESEDGDGLLVKERSEQRDNSLEMATQPTQRLEELENREGSAKMDSEDEFVLQEGLSPLEDETQDPVHENREENDWHADDDLPDENVNESDGLDESVNESNGSKEDEGVNESNGLDEDTDDEEEEEEEEEEDYIDSDDDKMDGAAIDLDPDYRASQDTPASLSEMTLPPSAKQPRHRSKKEVADLNQENEKQERRRTNRHSQQLALLQREANYGNRKLEQRLANRSSGRTESRTRKGRRKDLEDHPQRKVSRRNSLQTEVPDDDDDYDGDEYDTAPKLVPKETQSSSSSLKPSERKKSALKTRKAAQSNLEAARTQEEPAVLKKTTSNLESAVGKETSRESDANKPTVPPGKKKTTFQVVKNNIASLPVPVLNWSHDRPIEVSDLQQLGDQVGASDLAKEYRKPTGALVPEDLSTLFAGVSFLITGLHGFKISIKTESGRDSVEVVDHLSSVIRELGGTVIREIPTAYMGYWSSNDESEGVVLPVVLIAPNFLRTFKYMSAIAARIPTVHYNWVLHCKQYRSRISPSYYQLYKGYSFVQGALVPPDPIPHDHHPHMLPFVDSISEPGSRPKDAGDVDALRIEVVGASDFTYQWSKILASGGAHVVKNRLFTQNADRVQYVVCGPIPSENLISEAKKGGILVRKNDKKSIPLCSFEWVIQSILLGRFIDPYTNPEAFLCPAKRS